MLSSICLLPVIFTNIYIIISRCYCRTWSMCLLSCVWWLWHISRDMLCVWQELQARVWEAEDLVWTQTHRRHGGPSTEVLWSLCVGLQELRWRCAVGHSGSGLVHFSLTLGLLCCPACSATVTMKHWLIIYIRVIRHVVCVWAYVCDRVVFSFWRHVCLCVVSRFRVSRSHDVSAGVPWWKDHRGRGCTRHRHQALPRTPEGKSCLGSNINNLSPESLTLPING